MTIIETMGQRIHDLCVDKKLTHKEIAEYCNKNNYKCSEATISNIVNGVDKGVDYRTIIGISKCLGVSTDYLFGLTKHSVPVDTYKGSLIRAMCEYTGLTQETVELINKYKGTYMNDFISALYTAEAKDCIGIFVDKISAIQQFFNEFMDYENIARKLTMNNDYQKLFDYLIDETLNLEDVTRCKALCEFEVKKIADNVEKIVFDMFCDKFNRMDEYIQMLNKFVKIKHVNENQTDRYFSRLLCGGDSE